MSQERIGWLAPVRIGTGAPLGCRFPGFQLSRWGTDTRGGIEDLWNEGLLAGASAR